MTAIEFYNNAKVSTASVDAKLPGQPVIGAEIAAAADNQQGHKHHQVSRGKFYAVVQLDDGSAAVQVAIIAMLAQDCLGLGQPFRGFDRALVGVQALDEGFERASLIVFGGSLYADR